MTISIEKRLLNVAEYRKMAEVGILHPEDRMELISGEIIKMSPIKSNHASHVMKINTFLNQIYKGKKIINVQNPLHLNHNSEPEPDLMVLQLKDNFYQDHHPKPHDVQLLIEVADSSLAYDQSIKLPLYAEAGIPNFWIINLEAQCIEAYAQPGNGTYKLHQRHFQGDQVCFPEIKTAYLAEDLLIL